MVSHTPVTPQWRRELRSSICVFLVLLAGCKRDVPVPGSQAVASGGPGVGSQPVPVTLDELAARYRLAVGNDALKRDICIRALDGGHISIGASLGNVQRLCGADFQEFPGDAEDGTTYGIVCFVAPMPDYIDKDGRPGSGGYNGWSMSVLHKDARLLGCHLSNTFRGFSSEPKPEPLTLEQLAACYRQAVGGTVKRDVCLRAIDAGYISTPKPLANVRQLCGADFEESVGKERGMSYGTVRFLAPTADPRDEDGYRGLRLVVLYRNEQILDYYFSNTHNKPDAPVRE